jgi:hypothetical protein
VSPRGRYHHLRGFSGLSEGFEGALGSSLSLALTLAPQDRLCGSPQEVTVLIISLYVLKPAGHPGHHPSRLTFRLTYAVFLTKTSPVTTVFSPVTLRSELAGKEVTKHIIPVTGRGPVTFTAYLSAFQLLSGRDLPDRRFWGKRDIFR